jgi:hypothetical protein
MFGVVEGTFDERVVGLDTVDCELKVFRLLVNVVEPQIPQYFLQYNCEAFWFWQMFK